jgi:hypothetical protein
MVRLHKPNTSTSNKELLQRIYLINATQQTAMDYIDYIDCIINYNGRVLIIYKVDTPNNCFMFYVLCFMFYVLCFMFYVLCFMFYIIFYYH